MRDDPLITKFDATDTSEEVTRQSQLDAPKAATEKLALEHLEWQRKPRADLGCLSKPLHRSSFHPSRTSTGTFNTPLSLADPAENLEASYITLLKPSGASLPRPTKQNDKVFVREKVEKVKPKTSNVTAETPENQELMDMRARFKSKLRKISRWAESASESEVERAAAFVDRFPTEVEDGFVFIGGVL